MKNDAISGIVRNGVVVPYSPLREGVRVEITLSTKQMEFTPEEQAEFEAWNRLSDRALVEFEKMIQGESGDKTR